MTIPGAVISLIEKRRQRFEAQVIRTPRSEDMRAVAQAEISASQDLVVQMMVKNVRSEAIRLSQRFTRGL